MRGNNVLAISDLQIPFEHPDAFDFVAKVDNEFFHNIARVVVNQGDEVDQHTLSSKFTPNPDGMSGGYELQESILRLKRWYAAYPKTFVCTSNHTYRVSKKAYLGGIPSAFMKTIAEVYQAPPGWQWADKWIFNGVLYEHGENVSGPMAARRAAEQNRMSTSIGHQHTNGGVAWIGSYNGNIFGLNTGCLIDVTQYAFEYGKTLRNKPTLGIGVIKNGIPYFVPMITDQRGRWVGHL